MEPPSVAFPGFCEPSGLLQYVLLCLSKLERILSFPATLPSAGPSDSWVSGTVHLSWVPTRPVPGPHCSNPSQPHGESEWGACGQLGPIPPMWLRDCDPLRSGWAQRLCFHFLLGPLDLRQRFSQAVTGGVGSKLLSQGRDLWMLGIGKGHEQLQADGSCFSAVTAATEAPPAVEQHIFMPTQTKEASCEQCISGAYTKGAPAQWALKLLCHCLCTCVWHTGL